jgi:nicotinate-nucleotide adenylyltransferase
METIALFGGSFDPPHLGHIAVVEALKEFDFIDRVVIMPTFLNPFKSDSYASAQQRLQWLKEIFHNDKRVIIDDYEVNQREKTPTIKSVEYLLQRYKKIYLVIGADNLASLSQWYRFDTLQTKVEFIVATRDAIEIPDNYLTIAVKEDISSSQLRKKIDKNKLTTTCAEEIVQFYKEKHAKQNRKDNRNTR